MRAFVLAWLSSSAISLAIAGQPIASRQPTGTADSHTTHSKIAKRRVLPVLHHADLLQEIESQRVLASVTAPEPSAQLLRGSGHAPRYSDSERVARATMPDRSGAAFDPPKAAPGEKHTRTAQATFRDLPVVAQVAQGGSASSTASSQTPLAQLNTVTITGTLISTPGFVSPTPLTSVSANTIAENASTNVGEVVDNLPSFQPTQTLNNSGVNSRGGGQISANLRGLGTERTLVLVDGLRMPSTYADGVVDLGQIPPELIDHIDVVTGGASAAYGSDAVAGVLNIVLKKTLHGIVGNVQDGESTYGDNKEVQASLAGGDSLFGGRLQFIAGANYVTNGGILSQYTRPWGREEVGLITNANYATNGLPNYIITPHVNPATYTAGGLIQSGPLKGTAFAPNGTPYQYNYGQVFGSEMIGGEEGTHPNPALEAYLGKPYSDLASYGHAVFEITNNVSLFADLSGSWWTAGGASEEPRDTSVTIFQDNAYLPASIRDAMIADNLQSIQVGRFYDDIGPIQLSSTSRTQRAVVGLEGSFGQSWSWDASYQYGYSAYHQNFGPNNRIQANWAQEVDAVVNPATGAIVCASTLTRPNSGCVPEDIFGDGSAKVNSYAFGSAEYALYSAETVTKADVRGAPLSDWAGPVSLAGGADYRTEGGHASSDPISQQIQANGSAGGWDLGNQPPFRGSYDVWETYAEADVPLVKDAPLAKEADIDSAVRYTDYSISGGVTTWKVGLNYKPIHDLRFRGTLSRDIRAPNLNDLFVAGSGSSYTYVFDPVLKEQALVREIGEANIHLKPEKADTWTGGIVYEPFWWPGFGMSVDYWNIDLHQAISSIGAAVLVDGCAAGNQLYCRSVAHNSDGTIAYVINQELNLNELKTAGVDIDANYHLALDTISKDLAGTLGLHLLSTFVNDLITVYPAAGAVNDIGQLSSFNRVSGEPRWRGDLETTYTLNHWSLDLHTLYVGHGIYAVGLQTGTGAANTISNNYVPAFVYWDGGIRYSCNTSWARDLQIYFNVNNITNKAPPWLPSGAAGFINESSTAGSYYDLIGRMFILGFRFHL